jgi:hypothetical protein
MSQELKVSFFLVQTCSRALVCGTYHKSLPGCSHGKQLISVLMILNALEACLWVSS